MRQGMQEVSGIWKTRGNEFAPKASRRNTALPTTRFQLSENPFGLLMSRPVR